PCATSVPTTGIAASQRSPEKPAPQPMRSTSGEVVCAWAMDRMIEVPNSQVKWKITLDSSMQSMNISTRDGDAFLAPAQTQHFTRAAERCHLSQSAFSQKIGRIEASAGVKLFERSTRHVTLTPEGAVFAEEMRRIQSDMRQAFAGLQDLAQRRV